MSEKKTFTEEFKREAVRLSYESDLTVEQVSAALGIGKSTLTTWRRHLRDAPVETRICDPNEDALTRLRRENKVLRQEREILKKATAFFAREGSQ